MTVWIVILHHEFDIHLFLSKDKAEDFAHARTERDPQIWVRPNVS